jgi:hypothetical protein
MTTATAPAAIEIGPRTVPKRTLGWEILGWTKEYLLQPEAATGRSKARDEVEEHTHARD